MKQNPEPQDANRNKLDAQAKKRYSGLENSRVRRFYRLFASLFRLDQLRSQRLKMLYFGWGYWRILLVGELPLRRRLSLIRQFARVDWNVVHGHRPAEIAAVTGLLASRSPKPDEVMVEAGCWRGGSTAKFSILCELIGFQLLVFDSFEGVEVLNEADQATEWHFGGQYACPEDVVIDNVRRFGRVGVCEFRKGWFSETLAAYPVARPVRLAYIDCDLAKGTHEVLRGVMPSLSADGYLLSQDFHITPVRKMLLDPATWRAFGVTAPKFKIRSVYMVQLDWVN